MTATHTDSPATAAFRDYAATGDVTGLFALADYLDERGERKTFAKMLRRVAKRRDPDVWFFFRETGCYARDDLATAVRFAKAEDWFQAREIDWLKRDYREGALDETWTEDTDWDREEGDPDRAWVCSIREWTHRNGTYGWLYVASLSGITFGGDGYPDTTYARVVRAELCLEAMNAK